MNIQLVGGEFNSKGGKPSDIVEKIHRVVTYTGITCKVNTVNGGKTKHLKMLVELSKLYDLTIWAVDKYNGLDTITQHSKLVLIVDNREEKFTKENIRNTINKVKPNLLVEIGKGKNRDKFTIYGSKGHIWYNGDNVTDCVLYSLEILK